MLVGRLLVAVVGQNFKKPIRVLFIRETPIGPINALDTVHVDRTLSRPGDLQRENTLNCTQGTSCREGWHWVVQKLTRGLPQQGHWARREHNLEIFLAFGAG